jgi:hypothetical protein
MAVIVAGHGRICAIPIWMLKLIVVSDLGPERLSWAMGAARISCAMERPDRTNCGYFAGMHVDSLVREAALPAPLLKKRGAQG